MFHVFLHTSKCKVPRCEIAGAIWAEIAAVSDDLTRRQVCSHRDSETDTRRQHKHYTTTLCFFFTLTFLRISSAVSVVLV